MLSICTEPPKSDGSLKPYDRGLSRAEEDQKAGEQFEFELKKMKLSLAEVDKLKTNLDATQAQNQVAAVEATLVQLQAVACGPV